MNENRQIIFKLTHFENIKWKPLLDISLLCRIHDSIVWMCVRTCVCIFGFIPWFVNLFVFIVNLELLFCCVVICVLSSFILSPSGVFRSIDVFIRHSVCIYVMNLFISVWNKLNIFCDFLSICGRIDKMHIFIVVFCNSHRSRRN